MNDETVKRTETEGRGRFSLVTASGEAELTYALRGGVMAINHTYTPLAMRGHGTASQLMTAAVAYARETGLKISPLCSYADAWMRRHADAQDLLER